MSFRMNDVKYLKSRGECSSGLLKGSHHHHQTNNPLLGFATLGWGCHHLYNNKRHTVSAAFFCELQNLLLPFRSEHSVHVIIIFEGGHWVDELNYYIIIPVIWSEIFIKLIYFCK